MFSYNRHTHELICDMYGQTDGFVKIMQRKGSSGITSLYVPERNIRSTGYTDYLNNKMFTGNNMYISISTFKTKKSATEDNIFAIKCLCIDIDYTFRDKKGNLIMPDEAHLMLQQKMLERNIWIPRPTYVEYGHRLRYIYVFETPYILATDKKRRKDMITYYKRIAQTICENINTIDLKFNAEIQIPTKFIRVPESFNVLWKSEFNRQLGERKYSVECRYVIQTNREGKLWEIKELADEVLAPIPEWYGRWKNKKNKKGVKGAIRVATGNKNGLMDRYINMLERLQDNMWDEGYREKMCFLYWNFLKTKDGLSEEEIIARVKKFNKGFITPLSDKELISHARPRKTYKYKAETLKEYLDIPAHVFKSFGFFNKAEYNRKYMKNARDKKRKVTNVQNTDKKEMLAGSIRHLRQMGMTLKEIACTKEISVSTVKRYLKMKFDRSHPAVKTTNETNAFEEFTPSSYNEEYVYFEECLAACPFTDFMTFSGG